MGIQGADSKAPALCPCFGIDTAGTVLRDSTIETKLQSYRKMEQVPAYARLVAGGMIRQQLNKPFFGRPYLKYGQCLGLWSYLFELGGILAGRHAPKLDAFGSAFLGAHGDSGAVKRFFTEVANRLVGGGVNGSMTFWDYVQSEYVRRGGYAGDTESFFSKYAMEKIKPQVADEQAWEHASGGAALGAIRPELIRSMFERTHALVPKEQWERAYAAGLDIGPEQPRTSYKEAEEVENKGFMAYCQEYHPQLYSVLSA